MSAAPDSAGGKLTFADNEQVLCFHGPLLYEAKVLKAEYWVGRESSDESGPHYYVHYKGWKSTWDEWVPEARVVKLNEANLERQRQLKTVYTPSGGNSGMVGKKKSSSKLSEKSTDKTSDDKPVEEVKVLQKRITQKRSADTTVSESKRKTKKTKLEKKNSQSDNDGDVNMKDTDDLGEFKENNAVAKDSKGKKDPSGVYYKRADLTPEERELEAEFLNRPELQVSIPEALKAKLIDDWEHIILRGELVPLPRQPTVIEILNQYIDEKSKAAIAKGERSDIHSEVANGIKVYFEKVLSTMLLYASERQQLSDMKTKYEDKTYSEIYGAEHLLRLFVELPQLLAHTNIDEATAVSLVEHLVNFLRFLEKNETQYFLNEYEPTSVVPYPKSKKSHEKKTSGWGNNPAGLSCYNCGTSDTPGWRAGETSDQKLCNACGLYYAKYKSHRPQHLWTHIKTGSSK
ncbi:7002_t:CDS:10 [Paraglomus brasilianum]|uniref:Chromatin modification-related protein EAF3 n=1 Tax=Paraglomus brasilianum TaxID=144538 RepID=A0A9N8VUS0_9GLOM|nr:7002_t:CDS:10 [Paraglomus brasilianum]